MIENINKEITVAVWVVTYNHAPFIKDAINSILAQKTDFDFKIFIGEDCSTDGTREICIDFQKSFPDKIELLLQSKNTGGYQNAIDVYNTCFESGAKYLALLEGDDFWTDQCKLQNQINALRSNPNAVYCGSATKLISDNKNEVLLGWYSNLKDGSSIKSYHFFKLNSQVVLIDSYKYVIENFFDKETLNEYTISHGLDEIGSGVYYKAVTSAYRITGTGTWSSLGKIQRLESHFNLVRSLRHHLKKDWSFFALQELVTYLALIFIKSSKRIKYPRMRVYFVEECKVFFLFIVRLGFISTIPKVWAWVKQRRQTGVGV